MRSSNYDDAVLKKKSVANNYNLDIQRKRLKILFSLKMRGKIDMTDKSTND